MEEWKDIRGYEGLYQVSNLGRVKRIQTGKILSLKTEKNGYVRAHLSKNGKAKSCYVHRLVAIEFIPNEANKTTVNHIDENKQNNSDVNLEWATMSEQNSYGVGAKNRNDFKKVRVAQLDMQGNLLKIWDSIKSVCHALNLNPSSVTSVCRNKKRYKSTGGFKFRYVEGGRKYAN